MPPNVFSLSSIATKVTDSGLTVDPQTGATNFATPVLAPALTTVADAAVGSNARVASRLGVGLAAGAAPSAQLDVVGDAVVSGALRAATLSATDGSGLSNLSAANVASGVLAVARGGTGASTATGTPGSAVVLADSPTVIGTLTASNVRASGTITGNGAGLSNLTANAFSAAAVTGSGNIVRSGGPTLTGTTTVADLTASGTITGNGSGLNNLTPNAFGASAVTGTGTVVRNTNATLAGTTTVADLTASGTITGNGAGLSNLTANAFGAAAVTGTGTVVRSGGPTLTGNTIVANLVASGTITGNGSGLSNLGANAFSTGAVTGTGNIVRSAAPTLTGTTTVADLVASGTISGNGSGLSNLTANAFGAAAVTGTGTVVRSSDPVLAGTLTASNVTASGTFTGDGAGLSNLTANAFSAAAVTGSGTVVRSGGPTLTGTTTVANLVASGTISGNGSGLSNLDAGRFGAGTLPVARGGTGTTLTSGNVNSSNVYSDSPAFTGTVTASNIAASGSITASNLTVTGTVNTTRINFNYSNVFSYTSETMASNLIVETSVITSNLQVGTQGATFAGAVTANSGLTVGGTITGNGAGLSNLAGAGALTFASGTTTGTGALVRSNAPTLAGATLTGATTASNINATGSLAVDIGASSGTALTISSSGSGGAGMNLNNTTATTGKNYGIYSGAAGDLAFGTGPTSDWCYLKGGNLGVGDTNPGSKLTVAGAVTATGALTVGGALTGNGSGLSNLAGAAAATFATGTTTGTGAVVRSNAPTLAGATLTGTTAAAIVNASGLINANGGLTVASGQTLDVTNAAVTGFDIVADTTGTLTVARGGTGTTAGTGSGAVVLSNAPTIAGPTLTGTTTAAVLNASGAVTASSSLTVGGTITGNGAGLSNLDGSAAFALASTTGTGAVVRSNAPTLAGPTLTGTTTAAIVNASGAVTASSSLTVGGTITGNGAGLSNLAGAASTTFATGTTTGSGALVRSNAPTLAGATLTGTTNAAAITATGLINANGGLTVPAGQFINASGGINVPSGSWTGGNIVANGSSHTFAGTLAATTLTASGLITASGGLTVSAGQTLTAAGTQMNLLGQYSRVFTVPFSDTTTANAVRDAFSVSIQDGSGMLEIVMTTSEANVAGGRVYNVPMYWHMTSGLTRVALPITSTKDFWANDFELLVSQTNGGLTARVRRIAGSQGSGLSACNLVLFVRGSFNRSLTPSFTDLTANAQTTDNTAYQALTNVRHGLSGSVQRPAMLNSAVSGVWYRLGTFTMHPQSLGNACTITVAAGSGYNHATTALTAKNAIAQIFLRGGNGLTSHTNPINISGSFWSIGRSGPIAAVNVTTSGAITNATIWDVYVQANGDFLGVGPVTVETDSSSTFDLSISTYASTWVAPSGHNVVVIPSEWCVTTSGSNVGVYQAANGNVGIRKTDPSVALDVNGTAMSLFNPTFEAGQSNAIVLNQANSQRPRILSYLPGNNFGDLMLVPTRFGFPYTSVIGNGSNVEVCGHRFELIDMIGGSVWTDAFTLSSTTDDAAGRNYGADGVYNFSSSALSTGFAHWFFKSMDTGAAFTGTGAHVQVQLPYAAYIEGISFKVFASSSFPENLTVQGSTNGSSWTDIIRYTNIHNGLTANTRKTYLCHEMATTPYTYVRVTVSRVSGTPSFSQLSLLMTKQFGGALICNGNVGVGKTNPSVALDVNGSIMSSGAILADDVCARNNNAVIIRNPTSVGDGTMSPILRLFNNYKDRGSESYCMIREGKWNEPEGGQELSQVTFNMLGRTDGERTALTLRGNYFSQPFVGIGKTNPAFPLDVTGKASFDMGATNDLGIVVSGSANYGPGIGFTNTTASKAIGIYVAQDAKLYIRDNSANLLISYYSANGNLWIAGTLTQGSDDRLKDDETLIEDATSTLLKLRPQTYKKYQSIDPTAHSTQTPQLESGLIAQEVFYNAPELRHLVNLPEDANPLPGGPDDVVPDSIDPKADPEAYAERWGTTPASLNYVGLIPYLIKALQEQHAAAQSQAAKVAALEAKVAELSA